MLVDIARSVGGYLHDVFMVHLDLGILIGYIAQAMFAMRFVVQWIASERAGKSVVPFAFWIFSMVGGLMTLVYGFVKREPVIIFGQGLATLIYMRNIMLIFRERKETEKA